MPCAKMYLAHHRYHFYCTVESTTASSSLLNKCGCGKCCFETIVQCGCPTPRDDVKFPYLNMKSLTPPEAALLTHKLSQDFEMLQNKYGKLVIEFQMWMEQNIPLGKFKTILHTLPSFRVLKKGGLLLEDRKPEIKNALEHDELFIILSDYINWFQTYLLQRIVSDASELCKRSKDEIQVHIDMYKEELTAYCKRNIFECPPQPSLPIPPGTKYLCLKLSGPKFEIDRLEAIEISAFECDLTTTLKLYPDTLKVVSIHKGCVELLLCTPASVHSILFPLDDTTLKEITLLGVIEIRTEGYKAKISKEPPHFLHQILVRLLWHNI